MSLAGWRERLAPRRALRPAVFLLALSPLLWLGARALRGELGPNPIAEAENRLGFAALVLLLSSLACRPLQIVFGLNWPLRLRRMLGLFAFFYACLHLATYVGVDQFFDWAEIGKDVARRKFITVGAATWLLLLPLALTSTTGWVRRLGFRRWKRFHRLAYVAGAGAIAHFIWRFKTTLREPLAYAAVLAVLLAIRLIAWSRSARAAPPP